MGNRKYIEPNLVKIAADQDVFDILSRDGVPMKFRAGVYRHRVHDSMVISPGRGFYWFSQGYGSKSPIDYYMKVENMSFVDAAYRVLKVMNLDYSQKNIVIADANEGNPNYIRGSFNLPEAAETNKNVYAYLIKTRGLDKQLVSELLEKGLIYQDKKHNNAVFVGKDYEGNIVSAFKRSTLTTKKNAWKGDEQGSQKEYRFRITNPTNKTVNVFESEIDLLSYLSMIPELARNENYIALGGVSERAAVCFLENSKHIQHINICTDNDIAGHKFCEELSKRFGKDFLITREIPINKDFNEDLIKGVTYERSRIDVVVFDDSTKEMTRKEKLKYVAEAFSRKYQGVRVNLPYPDKAEFDNRRHEANINRFTKNNYRYWDDRIETNKSYRNKLNLGVEKDLIDLIETSTYVGTKEEVKSEQNSIHADTQRWNYFNKQLLIDNEVYTMVIDIREDMKHQAFVHKIRLKDENIDYIQEKYGEFSQAPLEGALNREQPPYIYNNDNKDVGESQHINPTKQADNDISISFSKDDEEMDF